MAASASSVASTPAPSAEAPSPPAKLPNVIYRRLEDSALGYPDENVPDGPLPPGYVSVAAEQTPASLADLLRGHRVVFVPEPTPGVCRKLVVDSLGRSFARLHENESIGNECLVRHGLRFEYEAGPLGTAWIEMHTLGNPLVLKGCRGIGFGIALCGEPVMLVVALEDQSIGFVETRGHLGHNWTFHAYAETARVDWYFDADRCTRESTKPKKEAGCGG